MRRERGVALVIVLGLVAVVAAWAADAAYEDMIALRLAENDTDAVRASQAATSALVLAARVLADDAKAGSTDDLEEEWAMETPPFPIDQGVVSGRIVDANRMLNLNDLVDAKGRVQEAFRQVLKRLFARLELDPNLVDALADWMDADDLPSGPGGAEEASYLDRPYRVKNARLDGIEELAMVSGFDPEVRARLAGFVTVAPVPESGITPVNVNTAPKEVLLALFPNMTEADAEAFIQKRPVANVAAVTGQPWAVGAPTARLSVASSLFIVRCEARFGRAVHREEFMLQRQGTALSIVGRFRPGWSAG